MSEGTGAKVPFSSRGVWGLGSDRLLQWEGDGGHRGLGSDRLLQWEGDGGHRGLGSGVWGLAACCSGEGQEDGLWMRVLYGRHG